MIASKEYDLFKVLNFKLWFVSLTFWIIWDKKMSNDLFIYLDLNIFWSKEHFDSICIAYMSNFYFKLNALESMSNIF